MHRVEHFNAERLGGRLEMAAERWRAIEQDEAGRSSIGLGAQALDEVTGQELGVDLRLAGRADVAVFAQQISEHRRHKAGRLDHALVCLGREGGAARKVEVCRSQTSFQFS